MGEKAFYLREEICNYLTHLDANLDKRKNTAYKNGEKIISNSKSKVKIYVIPTNEELMIARDTRRIVAGG